MHKTIALITAFAILSLGVSALTVKPTYAETVPTFSISTVSDAQVIPTTYSTDPYTGANLTNQGYTIYSFNITINVPSEPSVSAYLLQFKGHYASQWDSLWIDDYNVSAFASSGSQTAITVWGNNATGPFGRSPANQISLYFDGHWGVTVPFGSQVDFRVQALSNTKENRVFGGWGVIGTASDWSTIHTVTVAETSNLSDASPTPIQSQTPVPSVPEYSWLTILPLICLMPAILFIIRHKKPRNRRMQAFLSLKHAYLYQRSPDWKCLAKKRLSFSENQTILTQNTVKPFVTASEIKSTPYRKRLDYLRVLDIRLRKTVTQL